MKKTILILGLALTFPFALMADPPDGGKGDGGGPGGPGAGGPHRKHHGPGQGQGQDDANGPGQNGPGQKGGCQKGKGGPKGDKPEQPNNN